jgi:hypothetical protein
MKDLSGEDLRLVRRLGWPMNPDRFRVILPEVQRLLEAAERLRRLPIDPSTPPREPE